MSFIGMLVALAAVSVQSHSLPLSSESDPNLSRPATEEWLSVGGDWSNTRFSGLAHISRENVKQLGAVWVSDEFEEGSTSSVTPIIKNGVMFVTAGRHIYALNAKTGQRIWSQKTVTDSLTDGVIPHEKNFSARLKRPNPIANSRGVGLGRGLLFVGLMDGHVIGLSQKTGERIWIQQTGIDQPKKLQTASTAPTYIDGIVLMGLSNGDANLRGRITAIDAATGRKLWQLFSVPEPGQAGHETWPSFNDTWKFGGGGVWTNAAVDPELGIAYFATGNPVPAFAGDWRPGDNLYTCSVIAVDIKTGKIKWHYQLVRHDVFEADAGTPVILYDVRVGGRSRKALGVVRADGLLFQLDRKTGEPLFSVEERPVPQLLSQRTSPTQPFPVDGESILLSCEDWRRKGIPAGFVLGCMWTPPASPPPSSDPQNVLAPFPSVRVSPMAYSPQTGYFYAQATSHLSWPRRSQDPYHLTFGTPALSLNSYKHLSAVDGRTGKVVWRREVDAFDKGPTYTYMRGGPTVTAGGLVFRASAGGAVEAYDASNGELLWTFQTGAIGASGSAASYELDGEQYIALPMRNSVWAFKLGGKIAAAPPPVFASQTDEFVGPIEDTEEIETTSVRTKIFGSGTRYFFDEFTFNPYRARVRAGSKVLFVNNGSMRHEIMAVDNSWGTGPLSPAQEEWITFDKLGPHTYICKDHPWTYGQIIVTPDAASELEAKSAASDPQFSSADFDAQAQAGKAQFKKNCSACHSEGMDNHAMAPALAGNAFVSRWKGKTILDLFSRMRMTMPPASPQSLDDESYLSILAYLLDENSMISATSRLTDDPELMKGITLD